MRMLRNSLLFHCVVLAVSYTAYCDLIYPHNGITGLSYTVEPLTKSEKLLWVTCISVVVVLFLILIVIACRKRKQSNKQPASENHRHRFPKRHLDIIAIALLIAISLTILLPRAVVTGAGFLPRGKATQDRLWDGIESPFSCVIVEQYQLYPSNYSVTTEEISFYPESDDAEKLMALLRQSAGSSWTFEDCKGISSSSILQSGYLLHFIRPDGSDECIRTGADTLTVGSRGVRYNLLDLFHFDLSALTAWLSENKPALQLSSNSNPSYLDDLLVTDMKIGWRESPQDSFEYSDLPQSEWIPLCEAIGQIRIADIDASNSIRYSEELFLQVDFGQILLTLENCPSIAGDYLMCGFRSAPDGNRISSFCFRLYPDCHPFLPWIPETAIIHTMLR